MSYDLHPNFCLEMPPPPLHHLNIGVLVTADFLAGVKVGILVESTVTSYNWVRRTKNGPVSAIRLLATQILAEPSLLSVVWEVYHVDCMVGVGAAGVHCELVTA